MKSNQLLEKNNDDLQSRVRSVSAECEVLKERNKQLENDINTIYETIQKSSSFAPQKLQEKKKEAPDSNLANNIEEKESG